MAVEILIRPTEESIANSIQSPTTRRKTIGDLTLDEKLVFNLNKKFAGVCKADTPRNNWSHRLAVLDVMAHGLVQIESRQAVAARPDGSKVMEDGMPVPTWKILRERQR
jgi:hypothetical protein